MSNSTPSQSQVQRCSRCKVTKSITEFSRNKSTKSGYALWCKECYSQYYNNGRKRSYAYIDVPLGYKRCPDCNQVKELSEYHRHKRYKDGLQNYCRDCESKRHNYKSRRVSPYADVPEGHKRCLQCKTVYPANSENFSAQKHVKRDGLKSTCKNCSSDLFGKWYAAHRNEQVEKARKYRIENRETCILARKRWALNNPERIKIYKNNHSTRRHSLPADFSLKDWERALEYFDYSCAVCGKRPGFWILLARAHWIPLSKGGGFTVDNIIPLCHGKKGVPAGDATCNLSQSKKMPIDWLEQKFGVKKAKEIMQRINDFFEWAKSQKGSEAT